MFFVVWGETHIFTRFLRFSKRHVILIRRSLFLETRNFLMVLAPRIFCSFLLGFLEARLHYWCVFAVVFGTTVAISCLFSLWKHIIRVMFCCLFGNTSFPGVFCLLFWKHQIFVRSLLVQTTSRSL